MARRPRLRPRPPSCGPTDAWAIADTAALPNERAPEGEATGSVEGIPRRRRSDQRTGPSRRSRTAAPPATPDPSPSRELMGPSLCRCACVLARLGRLPGHVEGVAWGRSAVGLAALAVAAGDGSDDRSRRAEMTGERNGLHLRVQVVQANGVIAVETEVENRRRRPAFLVPDQCGRVTEALLVRTKFQPEGRTWSKSLQGLKRLVLDQQERSRGLSVWPHAGRAMPRMRSRPVSALGGSCAWPRMPSRASVGRSSRTPSTCSMRWDLGKPRSGWRSSRPATRLTPNSSTSSPRDRLMGPGPGAD